MIKSRRIRGVGYVVCRNKGGGKKGGKQVLVVKPEEKRLLGRPRRDDIRMDLQEVDGGHRFI